MHAVFSPFVLEFDHTSIKSILWALAGFVIKKKKNSSKKLLDFFFKKNKIKMKSLDVMPSVYENDACNGKFIWRTNTYVGPFSDKITPNPFLPNQWIGGPNPFLPNRWIGVRGKEKAVT